MKLNLDVGMWVDAFFRRVDRHIDDLKKWHPHFVFVARIGPGDWRFFETVMRRRAEVYQIGFGPRVVTQYKAIE